MGASATGAATTAAGVAPGPGAAATSAGAAARTGASSTSVNVNGGTGSTARVRTSSASATVNGGASSAARVRTSSASARASGDAGPAARTGASSASVKASVGTGASVTTGAAATGAVGAGTAVTGGVNRRVSNAGCRAVWALFASAVVSELRAATDGAAELALPRSREIACKSSGAAVTVSAPGYSSRTSASTVSASCSVANGPSRSRYRTRPSSTR